jgi:hypothetical protein
MASDVPTHGNGARCGFIAAEDLWKLMSMSLEWDSGRSEIVAQGQTYFAIQTRHHKLNEEHIESLEKSSALDQQIGSFLPR